MAKMSRPKQTREEKLAQLARARLNIWSPEAVAKRRATMLAKLEAEQAALAAGEVSIGRSRALTPAQAERRMQRRVRYWSSLEPAQPADERIERDDTPPAVPVHELPQSPRQRFIDELHAVLTGWSSLGLALDAVRRSIEAGDRPDRHVMSQMEALARGIAERYPELGEELGDMRVPVLVSCLSALCGIDAVPVSIAVPVPEPELRRIH